MALGDGDLPICEYLDILESAGYKGMYALEQNDPRYRSNPRQADIQSIRWLKSMEFLIEKVLTNDENGSMLSVKEI